MRRVVIHIKGEINQQWSDWFGGLAINRSGPGDTLLTGFVPDQAALYGIISRLRDLGLELVSVNSQKLKENDHGKPNG